ncbi:hypothetical protein SORBI_3006G031833 [Sorghum bicolor]|uniref:Uncharacterized protein n=1 Tax=Sorghum bicolor TaxID=4558 RepID=A0A1Z5RCR3_SORBI|nr:hypothetical protein SORBI_3006G031833 [Sorghum bicolor]OQU81234.1 hypothetical protein SORBI_3006G031833 [Sorghum bicolor]OQU81235.1 hypothetical protein SORBI_3006G031833 [Sorghum bicolor]
MCAHVALALQRRLPCHGHPFHAALAPPPLLARAQQLGCSLGVALEVAIGTRHNNGGQRFAAIVRSEVTIRWQKAGA